VKDKFSYIAVAGTKVSLQIRNVTSSIIGKYLDLGTWQVCEDGMPESSFIKSTSEMISFLEQHINKEKVDFTKYESELQPLLGRKRLAATFIAAFFRRASIHVNWTEDIDKVVVDAVHDAYERIVEDLTTSILKKWNSDGKLCYEILTVLEHNFREAVQLLILYSATRSARTLVTHIDLLSLGITHPTVTIYDSDGHKGLQLYSLSEQCAIDACVRVGRLKQLDANSLLLKLGMEIFEHSCTSPWQDLNASRGKPFENLFLTTLCHNYNGVQVSQFDFLEFDVTRGTRDFLKDVAFEVNDNPISTARYHDFEDTYDYFAKLSLAKEANDRDRMKQLVGTIIGPENKFHADAIVVFMTNSDEDKEPIQLAMLSFSFKMGHTVNARNSILSTALELSYVDKYKEPVTKSSKKLFDGMRFHVLFLTPKNHQRSITNLILTHGGKVVENHKSITHYIVAKSCKENFSNKRYNGKIRVTEQWVEDSIEAKMCMDYEPKYVQGGTLPEEQNKLAENFRTLLTTTNNKERTTPLIDHLARIHVHACCEQKPTYKPNKAKDSTLDTKFLPTNEVWSTITLAGIEINDAGSMNLIKTCIENGELLNKIGASL
jgi:5'-deoxynucleotidase YfbR-like HD superfamily hydrolase